MATKRVQFFSSLEEIAPILERLADALNFKAVMFRDTPLPHLREIGPRLELAKIQQFGATRIYLADQSLDLSKINPADLGTGELGLLQVTLPKHSGKTLYMAEVAIKSDWIEPSTGVRRDNIALIAQFRKFKTQLTKELSGSIIGRNVVTGGVSKYPALKYTPAVKNFFENGGELMQEGVNNVRFQPVD